MGGARRRGDGKYFCGAIEERSGGSPRSSVVVVVVVRTERKKSGTQNPVIFGVILRAHHLSV